MDPAARFYLEHLTERDLAALAGLARSTPATLASDPDLLASIAQSENAYRALFAGDRADPLAACSPVLAFSALLGRARRDLDSTQFIPEWIGPGRSVPVFDVAPVREFLDAQGSRVFLVELLASYTQVRSGSVWRKTARGWRRQRFNEMDPVALAQLLDGASEMERLTILRRLGDVSLFLTGIFPHHTGSRLFTGPRMERLEKAMSGAGAPLTATGGMELLELVGVRAYRTVAQQLPDPRGSRGEILQRVADGFRQARRFLNLVTSRYLHPRDNPWFPGPVA